MRLFLEEHPELDRMWYQNSRYLACLAAPNEDELVKLAMRCEDRELAYSIFREPDFDNAITAIAIEPTREGRRVTSNYPLALRDIKN